MAYSIMCKKIFVRIFTFILVMREQILGTSFLLHREYNGSMKNKIIVVMINFRRLLTGCFKKVRNWIGRCEDVVTFNFLIRNEKFC